MTSPIQLLHHGSTALHHQHQLTPTADVALYINNPYDAAKMKEESGFAPEYLCDTHEVAKN